MFSSQLCIDSGNYAAVNFVANGNRIGAMDSGDNNFPTCSSGIALAQLQKGHQIWLQVTYTSISIRNTDETGGFNSFAGYLISEIH